MSRLPDWEQRLHDFIVANRDRPFCWGEWDCALFAAAAVDALTGSDFGAPFRAYGYNDRTGAAAALKAVGAGTLVRTFDSHLRRKPVALACRGDIIMTGTAVGVCDGAAGWFVGEEEVAALAQITHREGLIRVPRRFWRKAWEV